MRGYNGLIIRDLCENNIEIIDPRADPAGDFLYIDISSVDNSTKTVSSPTRILGKAASVRARQVVRTNDIILSTVRPNLNAVAKITPELDGAICSTGFCVLRAKDCLNSNYLFLYVQSGAFIDKLNALCNGGLYPAVTGNQVFCQTIPWRDLNAQDEIATSLAAQLVESARAIEATRVQSYEIGKLSAAIYREAFLDVTPIAVPPTFPAAPTDWAWKKLSSVAVLESGHTPSRLQPEWWGGDISWLSLTEIRALDGTWVEQTQIRTNPAGIANSSARLLPRGTVCLSRTASVGFVAIMGKPMATSQDFANWVCGDDLDPEFLMFALIASRKAIREMATGATHKTIYMPALGSFHICAPKIDEQRRITKRLKGQLAEVAALQAALSQRVKDIAALPKRILAQAFEI